MLARHGIGALGHDRARHVREACEELGTTFIKLGQMLSMRADLLPPEFREELAKLQDDVPPVEFSAIEDVIVEELGASPELIFSWFDRSPLGCASIAQVHAARTREGRSVVVKVQKPNVRAQVETDLAILSDMLDEWSERFPVLKEFDAKRLLDDFSDSLLAELDYTREAANLSVFQDAFKDDDEIVLPEALEQLSTGRVLTLSRIEGVKPRDLPPLEEGRPLLARAMARFLFQPAFECGLFHADPHSGNFLVTRAGTLAAIDFGMCARLAGDARRKLADIFLAIDKRDAQRLADRLIAVAPPARPADRTALTGELDRILERFADAEAGTVDVAAAIEALLEVVREHRLRMPGNFAQLFKAAVMCECLVEQFDPHATLNEYVKPIVKKAYYDRFSREDLPERARESAADAADLAMELPRRVDRVLGELERGNLRVWTRLEDVDALVKRFERTAERTNATLLAAACIVAIAIVMNFYHPQGWERWIGIVFWVAVILAFVHVVRTLLALRK
ncbi:MAG TPA: AarF/UbiB family protein [Candidatus Baltobacteraceae bacterium]|nr:AarF/UbiB family protein [Candidatus Baltobacteraceae bacterium]